MKRDFWLGAFSASGVIAAGFTLRRAWRHSAANRQRITVPGLTDVSLEQVIKGYRLWLGVCSPSHLAPFRQRLREAREAARAEAEVFTVLRQLRVNPAPFEDVSRGRLDFFCEPRELASCFVEVTAIHAETVSKESKLAEQTET